MSLIYNLKRLKLNKKKKENVSIEKNLSLISQRWKKIMTTAVGFEPTRVAPLT